MISLENISVVFNARTSNETKALDNLSLIINEGDFAVVIGSNGSGKSTLLNVIAGTVATAGNIYIGGKKVNDLKEYERAAYISRVFQNPYEGTASDLSIIENFRLASIRTASKKPVHGTGKKFEHIVKDKISFLNMGLENNIYRPMGSLSGGQRQALTLVMGIMDKCSIMLLDEPVAALDPRSSAVIMEKADEIICASRLTALMVTHHLKHALQYGNRLIILQEGKVLHDFDSVSKKQLTIESLQEMI